MKLLANKQQQSYEKKNDCYICKERLQDKYAKEKNYFTIRDHCQNLKYSMPTQITIILHSRSNYDYHFIMEDVAEKF